MPKYVITAPNGEKFRVTAPEGATQEAVMAYAKQQYAQMQTPAEPAAPPPPEPEAPKPAYGEQLLHNGGELLKGLGETALNLGTGAVAQVAGGLSGIGTLLTGGGSEKAAANVENVQNTLTYQPRSEAGKSAATALGKVGEVVDKGSDWVGSGVAETTGSPALGAVAKALPTAVATLLDPGVAGTLTRAGAAQKALPKVRPMTENMTPTEANAAAVETLLSKDVSVPSYQRGAGFGATTKESLHRGADVMLGKSRVPEKQLGEFTRAALREVDPSIDATRAVPEVMGNIKRSVSTEYESLLAANPTRVDNVMVQELADVRNQILREVGESERAPLMNQIDDIIAKVQGTAPIPGPNSPPNQIIPTPNFTIDGKAAQNQRNSLVRMENSPNPSLKHFAGEIKEILDDAFERSAPRDAAERMRAVRVKHGKMKDIEKALSGNADGYITPAKLFTALSDKKSVGKTIYGQGDLNLVNLARAGKQLMKEEVGNSGTSARLADSGKIAAVTTAHVLTLGKTAAGALAARKIAHGNPTKGTLSDVRRRNTRPDTPVGRRTTAILANDKETPAERKRRLLAEKMKEKK
jgi:hypothetical protein